MIINYRNGKFKVSGYAKIWDTKFFSVVFKNQYIYKLVYIIFSNSTLLFIKKSNAYEV